jgi:hypothetical protein
VCACVPVSMASTAVARYTRIYTCVCILMQKHLVFGKELFPKCLPLCAAFNCACAGICMYIPIHSPLRTHRHTQAHSSWACDSCITASMWYYIYIYIYIYIKAGLYKSYVYTHTFIHTCQGILICVTVYTLTCIYP